MSKRIRATRADEQSVETISTQTDPAVVEDLSMRLRNTRWPDVPLDAGWTLGTDMGVLRSIVDAWVDFDWIAWEDRLNRLPRYQLRVAGIGIHFIHVRARATSRPALPLLLCHGWPDSFWRYLKVIPFLTDPGAHGGDPEDAFDLVIPDMPGFGYSEIPDQPVDAITVADLWAQLMSKLGYSRFGAAGGDIGSHVSRFLALNHPSAVLAVHRTDAGVPVFDGDPADLTQDERDWFAEMTTWGGAEGAYAAMQRTKPQTAAVALQDSPAGLASWIIEKMQAWSDGGLASIPRDDLLANLMIYWVTSTIGSSMRMYHANAAIPRAEHLRQVEVPSGFSIFQGDVACPPRAWLQRTGTKVVSITEPPHGGHFSPVEQPGLYASELAAFFRAFR